MLCLFQAYNKMIPLYTHTYVFFSQIHFPDKILQNTKYIFLCLEEIHSLNKISPLMNIWAIYSFWLLNNALMNILE